MGRVATEYREPTFRELWASIRFNLLLCVLTPAILLLRLLVFVFKVIFYNGALVRWEFRNFLRTSCDFIKVTWGGLYEKVKLLVVKLTWKAMEASGTTPPAYIRRQRRGEKMPRLGPRREFQEFEYAPLVRDSEIRLFVIPPAEEGWVDLFDGIAGNLIRADLLTEPEYDALSYSWGSESGDYSRDYQILISPGTPDEGVVRVTHNCAQAITRLRLEGKPRAVWIDAICINQNDPSERSHQVSIMSNIYTSARQVVAYTGRGSAQTDQLFDYLNSVDEKTINVPTPPMSSPTNWLTVLESEIKQPGTWLRRKLESSFFFRHRPDGDVPPQQIIPDDIPQPALAFFNLRYFTRVWTLQETLLPSLEQTILICGDKTTSAARALHVLSILQSTSPRPSHTSASPTENDNYEDKDPQFAAYTAATRRLLLLLGASASPRERRNKANYILDPSSATLPGLGLTPRNPLPILPYRPAYPTPDLGRIYTLIRHRAGSAAAGAAGACLEGCSGATTAPASSPAARSHLLDILLATRHRGASDPRDRIYGVLSIAWGMDGPYRRRHHDSGLDFYSVDYSLRSEEVYARYSEMFIRHYGVGFWFGLRAWRDDVPEQFGGDTLDSGAGLASRGGHDVFSERVDDGDDVDSDEQIETRYLPSWAAEWGESFPFPSFGRNRDEVSDSNGEFEVWFRGRWRKCRSRWVNERVMRDADAREEKFPAAMRNVEGDDPETQRVRFEDSREPGGRTRRVMVLEGRRRVKQGWVVRDVYGVRAQRDEDDEEDVKDDEPAEEISGERGDQVFVEMYPGFVAILKREGKSANHVFVQAAAHGRTKHEAKELAEKWGRVVFDGAGWEGAYSDKYFDEVETFRIL